MAHKNAVLLIQFYRQRPLRWLSSVWKFHHYAKLIIESERDALTGLLNRKTFDHCVSKILLNDYKPEYRFLLHYYLVILYLVILISIFSKR
ncbi:hypothetical protein [Methylophilus aquaticus]|uniref:Uncharacterized protein n=1 Tax=Methylophilus aquaticus TaxID=1971610 RepID=A0ABT9JTG0_9PROT|nr:hypothetical protein [Methylophilus aquaticus]MDP8567868.1 hypothetical protein [Methylophilus aquaticus]